MSIPAIAIHGGAGAISRSQMSSDLEKRYLGALQNVLDTGFTILRDGGMALDAVVEAVRHLENCELFNAGKGSVFTARGVHKMDASVMEGKELKTGAVAEIHNIKNPVLLAKKVLDSTEYVLITGEEANDFAKGKGFEHYPDSYFFTQKRYDQWLEVKNSDEMKLDHSVNDSNFGTVGAVAVDKAGDVAAATSTGGMVNKAWGRVGDSAVIGAGTYANNQTCAVSCTGEGEFFMRSLAAYDVSALMEYKKRGVKEAAAEVLNRVKKLGGEGGLIATDARGNITLPFNSAGMYRGMKNNQRSFTAIY